MKSDEKQELKSSQSREFRKPKQHNTSEYVNQHGDGSPAEYNPIKDESDSQGIRRQFEIFGGICLGVSILIFFFFWPSTTDESVFAKDALKNKMSASIKAGTVLATKDENFQAKDYVIVHKSDAKETKIWVWDYAAEDGDYVQILVNGTPITDAFMIKNKPREIIVPASGDVQIKGIRDGGGGITYAVRYEINGTSYFNGAGIDEFNSYTLKKE